MDRRDLFLPDTFSENEPGKKKNYTNANPQHEKSTPPGSGPASLHNIEDSAFDPGANHQSPPPPPRQAQQESSSISKLPPSAVYTNTSGVQRQRQASESPVLSANLNQIQKTSENGQPQTGENEQPKLYKVTNPQSVSQTTVNNSEEEVVGSGKRGSNDAEASESDSYVANEDDDDDDEDQEYREDENENGDSSSDSTSEKVIVKSPIPLMEGVSPHIPQNASLGYLRRQYPKRGKSFQQPPPPPQYNSYQPPYSTRVVHSANSSFNNGVPNGAPNGVPNVSEVPRMSPALSIPNGAVPMNPNNQANLSNESQYLAWSSASATSDQYYDPGRSPLVLAPNNIPGSATHRQLQYRGAEFHTYRGSRGGHPCPPPSENSNLVPVQIDSKPMPWTMSGHGYDNNYGNTLMYEPENPDTGTILRENSVTPPRNVAAEPQASEEENDVSTSAAAAAAAASVLPPNEELHNYKYARPHERRAFSGRVAKQQKPVKYQRRRVVSESEEPPNYDYQYPPPSRPRERGRSPMEGYQYEDAAERYRRPGHSIPDSEIHQWSEYDGQYRFPMPMMQIPQQMPPIPPYMYSGVPGVPNSIPTVLGNVPMDMRAPPGPHRMIPTMRSESSPVPYMTAGGQPRTQQVQAQLEILGNLMDMTQNWTEPEKKHGRRLVYFERDQLGVVVKISFRAISAEEYREYMTVISCIWHQETNQYFVTSVDCISLLELIINQKFSVEEKNRIRRNLEVCKPMTVSKSRPELVPFFQLIMSFSRPRPRNIEKGVKVFLWSNLEGALKKIVSKYSASWK